MFSIIIVVSARTKFNKKKKYMEKNVTGLWLLENVTSNQFVEDFEMTDGIHQY